MKLRAFLLLLTLFGISCSKQTNVQTLSQSEFSDSVAAAIGQKHPDLCIKKHDSATIYIGRDEKACREVTISTTYVFEHYLSNPTQLRIFVDGLTATANTAIESISQNLPEIESSRIVFVIRPTAYVEYSPNNKDLPGGVLRPFVGDLIILMVERNGEQARSLTFADLKRLGLSEDKAWTLALENVKAQIGALQTSPNSSGAEVVTATSGLAPSHLLLPGTCTPGGANFDAFLVSRDTYFYADQKSATATAMLAGYVAQLLKSGENTYSNTLISCINGRWFASKFDGNNTWRPIDEKSR